MSYYYLHEQGYKFCEKIKELTHAQIVYLGKAREHFAEKSGNGSSVDDLLKQKYKRRVTKKKRGGRA